MLPANRNLAVALPECTFGPLLAFVGNYGPPERPGRYKGSGDRKLQAAATEDVEQQFGAQAAAEGAQAAAGVQAAAGFDLFPDWCQSSRWWVEQIQPGKMLFPADIHAAMVATRKARLGV